MTNYFPLQTQQVGEIEAISNVRSIQALFHHLVRYTMRLPPLTIKHIANTKLYLLLEESGKAQVCIEFGLKASTFCWLV